VVLPGETLFGKHFCSKLAGRAQGFREIRQFLSFLTLVLAVLFGPALPISCFLQPLFCFCLFFLEGTGAAVQWCVRVTCT
jgi:hypothetical protein